MKYNKSKKKTVKISRKSMKSIVSYIILTLIALATIIPFIWTLSTSLKGGGDSVYSFPPEFIPRDLTFDNYITAWTTLPIPLYLWNSIVLTFFKVLLPLIAASMAAYPLARMKFKGRQVVFMIIIAVMMIPSEITMIPIYLIIDHLKLLDTFTGVVLPGIVNVFGIFLLRQAFLGIPREIEESAFIDGANVWQIWSRILLPMLKPMLATLCVFFFVGAWNDFIWPLLILNDPDMYPLTLGLYKLQGTFFTNVKVTSAGAMIALLPVMFIFVALQRFFIEGNFASSVKG